MTHTRNPSIQETETEAPGYLQLPNRFEAVLAIYEPVSTTITPSIVDVHSQALMLYVNLSWDPVILWRTSDGHPPRDGTMGDNENIRKRRERN